MAGCKNRAISSDTKHLRQIAMRNIYRRLLLLIVGATQKELARYVRFLKTENQVLRSQCPARIAVTPQQRRQLVRFGQNLGRALDELVSIVHPDTLRRWIREEKKGRKPVPAKGPTSDG